MDQHAPVRGERLRYERRGAVELRAADAVAKGDAILGRDGAVVQVQCAEEG